MLSSFLFIPQELTFTIKTIEGFQLAMQEVEPALRKHLNPRGRRLSVFSLTLSAVFVVS